MQNTADVEAKTVDGNDTDPQGAPNVDALIDCLMVLKEKGQISEENLTPYLNALAVRHLEYEDPANDEYVDTPTNEWVVDYLTNAGVISETDAEVIEDELEPEPETPEETPVDVPANDEDDDEDDEDDDETPEVEVTEEMLLEALGDFEAPVLIKVLNHVVGGTSPQVAKILRKLRESGAVVSEGTGTGTRYILTTKVDEATDTEDVDETKVEAEMVENTEEAEPEVSPQPISTEEPSVSAEGSVSNQLFDTNTEWIIHAWKDQNPDADLGAILDGRPNVPGLLPLLRDQGLIGNEDQVWAIVDEILEIPALRDLIEFINGL